MENIELHPSQNSRNLLVKWIGGSSIGATIGMIIFFALGFYSFAHGGELPPLPREYMTDKEVLQRTLGYIVLYSFIVFFSALPYGLSQWLILRKEYKISFLWVFTYSLGLILFITTLIAGWELPNEKPSYFNWFLPILGWFVSNVLTGGFQILLLRGQIHRAQIMIPINLLAAIAFGVSVIIGFALNLAIYCIGAIVGGALAGIAHSSIIGLFLLRKPTHITE